MTTSRGPNAAERRVLEVYDAFLYLLNTKPHVAAQLSYDLLAIAQRYQKEHTRETRTPGVSGRPA